MDFISNLFGRDKNQGFIDACKLGKIGDVEKLIKNDKVDVNSQNAYGKTGLICAANLGYRDVIELLIENGANPDFQEESDWYPIPESTYAALLLKLTGTRNNGPEYGLHPGEMP